MVPFRGIVDVRQFGGRPMGAGGIIIAGFEQLNAYRYET